MNVYIIAYTAHIIISHPPGLPVNTSIYIRLNTEYTPSITAHTLLFANWIPSPSPTTITTSNMPNTFPPRITFATNEIAPITYAIIADALIFLAIGLILSH